MTVSDLIAYTKLVTRTLDTVLSDAELLTLTKIAISRVYMDLEVLFVKDEFTVFNSEDTAIALTNVEVNIITNSYIVLTNKKVQTLLVDDIRDKDLHLTTNSDTNANYIFHAKEYSKVEKLVMVYSTPIMLTDIVEVTSISQRLLEPVMSYIAYSTYKLLGLKDLEVALFHKQEYLETIDRIKKHYPVNSRRNLTLARPVDVIEKGFV